MTAMAVSQLRDILGVYCPACGQQSLHLTHTGVIRCFTSLCPAPDAAQQVLSDRETRDIVEFTDGDFRMLHPLRERIGGSLFGCPVNEALMRTDGPPQDYEGKRYRAHLDEDGKLVLEPLTPEGS
jgi:Family of unknown function (DUF6085)